MMRKIKIMILAIVLSLSFAVPVFAVTKDTGGSTTSTTPANTGNSAQLRQGNGCANVPANKDGEQTCLKNDPIIKDLKTIVNAISGLVGVVVIAMIITGGIQYSLARNNPNQIGAAQKRIINALIALIAYALIFAFLQWIIPGGVFSNA